MAFIDFIKQFATRHLPKNHLLAVSALSFTFITLIFSGSEYQDNPSTSYTPTSFNTDLEQAISPVELKEIEEDSPLLTTTSKPTQAKAIEPIIEIDSRFITEVQAGDNLSLIFTRAGLTAQDVYKISNSGSSNSILNKLYPGYNLAFDISESGQLMELEILKTPLESYLFSLNSEAKFDTEHILRSPEIEQVFKEAQVQNSLFLAAQRGGISAPITMEIAGIFGGVIDFMLDTRSGDSFNVLYEEKYFNDEFIGDGSIQVAQFTNQGETFTAIRYENLEGDVGYFNPEGESMRKAFLRNPVDFTRISSGFNPSRRHPILNTIRAHRGTDYAAPRGTPVVATGDGRVTWAARNGSFGKLVVLQHGNQFETKYAHLSSYANGIRNGARVRQGQVIGYVGTTGSATGPHLHYEFLMNGVHRNSRTIHSKLPKAESISPEEMQRFQEQSQILLSRLDSYTDLTPSLAQNTFE